MEPFEIQRELLKLPSNKQQEVINFILFLQDKKKPNRPGFKFEWAGCLKDLRDKYTSVELQHEILKWRSK